MKRRFVDLSIYLENEVLSDPPGYQPRIDYIDHRQSVEELVRFFPGLRPQDLPDGEAWAIERVQLITHNGTHLDAPYHFASTQDRGRRALTIDEVPLEWCFQPGVKLDFRHFPDGYVVRRADLDAELERIGHALAPLEIVLVNTRTAARYGHDDYVSSGCGMGREATLALLEQGVRLTGTDGSYFTVLVREALDTETGGAAGDGWPNGWKSLDPRQFPHQEANTDRWPYQRSTIFDCDFASHAKRSSKPD